jgi:hypothetical protein
VLIEVSSDEAVDQHDVNLITNKEILMDNYQFQFQFHFTNEMKNWMSVSVSVETENASISDIQILQILSSKFFTHNKIIQETNRRSDPIYTQFNKNTSQFCI